MLRAALHRIHNPRGRTCGCDHGCWCRRTAVGRAVRWWFPARSFGIRHAGAAADWKRAHPEGDVADWKRRQAER